MIIVLAGTAAMGLQAFAQAGGVLRGWTLDDCVSYAVAHAASVQKKTVEASDARADVQAALGGFLPSVGANVSGQYSWGRNVDPETNTYKTVNTFNNYYNLYASLPLFDGGQTISRFRQARLLRQQGLTELQRARDDKAIEVMQKFVDAVYAQHCVELAGEKLAESRRLLAKTQRMEELGLKSRPDVAQIASQVAEDDYGLTHGENQLQAAMLALKSVMNYPAGDSLRLTADSLRPAAAGFQGTDGNAPAANGLRVGDIFSFASLNNPQARSAMMNVRKAELDLLLAKGRLLPTLSLEAGVSTSYFRSLTGGSTASPFHAQFTNNMGEYVAATLSLPLFELSRYAQVRKARNKVRLSQLERDETLRRLHDDINQAVLDCEGYAKEVAKMERKVASDSLAYHLSSRKYEEGLLSTFELRTASATLLESRIRLLQVRMLYVIRQRLVNYYQGYSI